MATLIDANQAMFTPFEPKLKNRFVMSIDGIPGYLIKTANRPSITFEEDKASPKPILTTTFSTMGVFNLFVKLNSFIISGTT